MSDPTNPSPTSCCGPAIADATRVAVAKAHCAIYRERCSSLESQLDSACDEINAHREFHENDLTREHRDLLGNIPCPAPEPKPAPTPAPAPSKPASPIATPGDARPASGVTARKRATKRKA